MKSRILFILVGLFAHVFSPGSAAAQGADDEAPPDEEAEGSEFSRFLDACTHAGKSVEPFLAKNPDWVHRTTSNGETCLHLTGIYGHTEATEILLKSGAHPNVRSTYSEGLDMHPLSWNAYAGHVPNAELLLRHGAQVNAPVKKTVGSHEQVTALDIVNSILDGKERGGSDEEDLHYEKFFQMRDLVIKHGGVTFADLAAQLE